MREAFFVCAGSAMVVVGILGCGEAAPPAADSVAASIPVAAAPAPAPAGAEPSYRRGTAIDLTGDGQADSVHLEMSGARVDSQPIVLRILVGGEEKLREAWSRADEFAHLDSAPRTAAVLRARLDTVLASVKVQRFDAPGVRILAEDTAVLSSLIPRPKERVSISYGYETMVRLVWDAPRRRLVRLWSCC